MRTLWLLPALYAFARVTRAFADRIPILAVVAAFVMVAWDLSMDPVWSNLVRGWVWHDGDAWVGVPVSNFSGWYLTASALVSIFIIGPFALLAWVRAQ